MLSQRGDGGMMVTLSGHADNRAGWVESDGSLTFSAAELDNTDGTLQAAGHGNLTLNIQGDITNSRGKLLASGAVSLTARQLDSQSGLVSARGGDATLSLSQALNNAGGRIEARYAVDTRSQVLSNVVGTVLGKWVSIDTRQGQLFNTDGSIVADGRLQINSGGLDNAGGRLQAGDYLRLDTHGQALSNTRTASAGILSGALCR
ncbi:hypothetical protein O0544_12775 [Edwardsiella anguillarum]|nr:hypothetical protein [Edwardsiella anguillarum]